MDHNSIAEASLKAAYQYLTTTPAKKLPLIASRIASLISRCPTAFANADGAKTGDTAVLLVRKFKTRLQALANEKHPECHWTAVVLIKAVVEAGGLSTVKDGSEWVRLLLSYLDRRGPSTTKVLSVLTLTRIFIRTQTDPGLTREVTIKSLPGFINSCMNHLVPNAKTNPSVSNRLVETIIDCFANLLPRHPTTFRAFRPKLTTFLTEIMAPSPHDHDPNHNSKFVSSDISAKARKLFVLTHMCAPKSTSAEFEEMLRSVLSDLDSALDIVFACFSADGQNAQSSESSIGQGPGALGLPQWTGISSGCARVLALLGLLREFIGSETNATVSIPLGRIVDVSIRVVSTSSEPIANAESRQLRTMRNPADRQDLEIVLSRLCELHVAACDLLNACFDRFGAAVYSLHGFILEHLCRSEGGMDLSAISTITTVLSIAGCSLSSTDIRRLEPLVQSCCNELVSLDIPSDPERGETLTRFLKALLLRVPAQHLSRKARSAIDQVGVVLGLTDLMVASILNPAPLGSSILPLLAQRQGPFDLAAEALIRPRAVAVAQAEVDHMSDHSEAQSTQLNVEPLAEDPSIEAGLPVTEPQPHTSTEDEEIHDPIEAAPETKFETIEPQVTEEVAASISQGVDKGVVEKPSPPNETGNGAEIFRKERLDAGDGSSDAGDFTIPDLTLEDSDEYASDG